MSCATQPLESKAPAYPSARRGDDGETLWDAFIPDPYRWMETPSAELDAWLDAQDHLADAYCASLPEYEHARALLSERASDALPPTRRLESSGTQPSSFTSDD